jgi:FkbM family methyltransferase
MIDFRKIRFKSNSKLNTKNKILNIAWKNKNNLKHYLNYLIRNDLVENLTISRKGITINFYNINLLMDLDNKFDIGKQFLFLGQYENFFLDFLQKFKEEYPTFIDVGANIGLHSLIYSLKPTNKIIAFEPVKRNYEIFAKNLIINNSSNIIINNFALMDLNHFKSIHHDLVNPAASSFKQLFHKHNTSLETVEIKTLDSLNLSKSLKSIDLIKIDTEGSELFVLKGAIKTISLFKPLIILEMLRKWSFKFDYHPNDIIALLSEIGYETFAFSEDGFRKINYVDKNTIETNFIFKHLTSTIKLEKFIAPF